ncbi:hypothetical protein Tco_0107649, partial [Tanacetum coccineum]
ETIYKEWEDIMERAATTASSLDTEQDSGSGPRCQDTILGGVDAQTRFETTSNSPMIHLSQEFPYTRKWRGQYETYGIDDTLYKTVCIGELKRIERFVIEK